MSVNMSDKDLREWAKETLLEGLDDCIRAKGAQAAYPDDLEAMVVQRNRIAKFLGFDDPCTLDEILNPGERFVTVSLGGLTND